jgi:hypothetical protein
MPSAAARQLLLYHRYSDVARRACLSEHSIAALRLQKMGLPRRVPKADPPPQRASKGENSVNEVPLSIDPDLVRTIHDEELFAREQWVELPETITANELASLEGTFK